MAHDDKHLEEMIEVDEGVLSLKEINIISKNQDARQRYEKKYQGTLYSTILKSLTHESYSEEEATLLCKNILEHMHRLDSSLGREVGVSVATLDYLTNITNTLLKPIIIEQDKSAFVSRATTTDELTALYLKDVFDVMLKKEVDEANRKNTPLCLLMIDIDDFKKVNDLYGHLIGDKTLTKVGACIHNAVREMDFAARYGGEELAVIMPDTELDEALIVGERIRHQIESLHFDNFSITVSIGLAKACRQICTPDNLIQSSDEALYTAKSKGKNQVVVAKNTDQGSP